MTTFNFSDFCHNCITARDGLEMYDRTSQVLAALKACDKPVTPTELAEVFNDLFAKERFGAEPSSMMIKPLHWLLKLGLVDRESYTLTIKMPKWYAGYETKTVTIDGIVYQARVPVKGDTKEVTCYRWFAK